MKLRNGLAIGVVLTAALLFVSSASALPIEDCMDDPCKAGCADPCYMDSHEQQPGQGVPVHWASMPIKYKINAEKLPAGLDKDAVIAAIQAAFTTWEGVECTEISFQYEGESTSYTEEPDHILVFFGNDAATWIYGTNAYFTNMQWTTYAEGEIDKGIIGMNSGAYGWSIGAETDKIDIQTAVTWMIPSVIGFYVGNDISSGSLPIVYNKVQTDLCPSQTQGAQMSYYKADAGCTQPNLTFCTQGSTPTGDGGVPTGDGGVPTGDGSTPTGDGSTPTGDGPIATGDGPAVVGDGGLPPGEEEDDGCCRVSHARSTSSMPYLSLLGLAILLALARRRRR